MPARLSAYSSARTVASLLIAAGIAVSAIAVAPTLAQTEKPAASAAGSDTVPIRKIVLYRSGVGYFERMGTVNDAAEIQLRFNAEQINDILKSMVLLDLDGGRVDTVSYASKEPLSKRLASFGLNISNNPSIPELLGQLRGAPLKVIVAGEQITGTVLGVEERLAPSKEGQPPLRVPHLNLVTPTGLRSIAITDVSSFEILDEELAAELTKALSTLAEYRADRTKTVDLRFSGQGSRRVVVGYVHEMPVWKTSYRLVLPEAAPAKPRTDDRNAPPSDQVLLQGWAVVENTTDADWNNVSMSLVSGRPVSFQMDLYEPLYTFRPMIPVPTIPGVMPRSYVAGVEQNKAVTEREQVFMRSRTSRADAAAAPAPASAAMEKQTFGGYEGLDADAMADYAVAAQAQAGEVGEVFQYTLNAPVSIERQRSAMIPILTSNIPARRVSIYNPADGSDHPMRGVEITNDSDLQLLPGPISVFDGAAYAGDAQIGHVGQGDKRLLSYAIDLDVDVLSDQKHHSSVMSIRIVNGLIEQTIKNQLEQVYTFDNKDAKRPRTIFVEHPKPGGDWSIINPGKPDAETQTHYRFIVEVPADKKSELKVVAERVARQSIGVLDMNMTSLIAFNRSGKLSDKALEAVRKAANMQAAIAQLEKDINTLNSEADAISKEQSRIRENMKTIDSSGQLYGRYMTKLNEQETQLEDIAARRIAAQQQLDQRRAELNDYLRNLNVD